MPLSFVWVNLTQFWLKRTFSNGFAYRVLFIKSQPLSHLLLESLVVKSIQSKTHFWSIFGRLKGVGFSEFDEFWLWKWFWVYFYDYFGRIAIKVNYWPFLDSPNNRIKIHSVHITNSQVYSWTYSKKNCLFQSRHVVVLPLLVKSFLYLREEYTVSDNYNIVHARCW